MHRDAWRHFGALILTVSLGLAGAPAGASAQTDRDVLRQLLRIYYVDQPDTPDPAYEPELVDNAAVASGTETGPFWTNPAIGGLQDLVRRLLRDEAGGGDPVLQFYVARIVGMLHQPVKVNLLDDTGGPITTVARQRWGACVAGGGWAWPCASNMARQDDDAAACAARLHQAAPARRDDAWAGNITLGETYIDSAASPITARATFVHELVHTQDYADWRGHLFWINGRTYRYGADDVHYSTEAVPDLAMSYKEGIANGMSLLYAAGQPVFDTLSAFQWFASNGELLVEKNFASQTVGPGAVPACAAATQPSADNWLYNQLSRLGVREAGPAIEMRDTAGTLVTAYAVYHVRDLPPRFLAHNEYILALIIQQYATHAGLRPLLAALEGANQRLFRVSASGVATLFDVLARGTLPAGTSAASLAHAASSGPRPYLLGFAYVDYFTGFQATSPADLKAYFENMGFMDDWMSLYWDARPAVQAAVRAGHPQMEDLTSIALALGITQSTP